MRNPHLPASPNPTGAGPARHGRHERPAVPMLPGSAALQEKFGTIPAFRRFIPVRRVKSHGETEQMFEYSGVFGILLLALDLWAIISIVGSGRGTGAKVLWILLVLVLPLLGFVIWFFAGPRSAQRT